MTHNTSDPIFNLIDNLSIGEIQYHEGITVFPLMTNIESIPYITLKEAHANQLIQISEVSESGSIPELRVVNFSQKNILLIDGEELAGAKQNRILNTTILVPANGDVIIPVSCTEEGRWSYDTPNFYDSDELASSNIRARKMGYVSDNLKTHKSYASDQGDVWDNIRLMREKENIFSRTGSMKDIYDHKRRSLDMITDHFPVHEGQKGLLVFSGNGLIGLDVFSNESAYKQYHEKLLRSYIISVPNPETAFENSAGDLNVGSLLENIRSCKEETFSSKGIGLDHRYTGPGLVGLMLSVEHQFVHAAFFNDHGQHGYYRTTGRIYRNRRYR